LSSLWSSKDRIYFSNRQTW